MPEYAVRTVYYFDQVVEAESAEEAMINAGDLQPSEGETDRLGLYEVSRVAEDEPVN